MVSNEVNFDGLVGPTHNYAGLSEGNVASKSNANCVSNPRLAAKQGLSKMLKLHNMGLIQGVLAPQERPDIATLRRLGFQGNDAKVLDAAAKQAPSVLAACYSASSMWTANAATVSPSADSLDRKIHFTPANLSNKFHRSLEPETTGRVLKAVFNDPNHFVHHQHLNSNEHFGDEGAANHTRLCVNYEKQGLQIFTFGRYAFKQGMPSPNKFPARQTFEASKAIARLHQLDSSKTIFVQQNPDLIDQGVFHNDVIAVGNQNVLFYHEQAYLGGDAVCEEIEKKFDGQPIYFVKVESKDVSVVDAINTYLFNSQLIKLDDGNMIIIAPSQCLDNPNVKNYLNKVTNGLTPIAGVEYMDINESMRNGGGPACLRLRVAMNQAELNAVNPGCILNQSLLNRLNDWIDANYRDRICSDDLRDPSLLIESRVALDELTQILTLGSIYDFQREPVEV
jgi:succinylarginine dihydrolase